MKSTVQNRNSGKVIPFTPRKAAVYPNAAGVGYFLNKLFDCLLTAASSAGIIAALMFLITYF